MLTPSPTQSIDHPTLPPLDVYLLAGGKSMRFGSDKALAVIDSQPNLVRLYNELRTPGNQVTVVASSLDDYASLGLPTIADSQPFLGPLSGVITSLSNSLQSLRPSVDEDFHGWCLIVPCDLLEWQSSWLHRLFKKARSVDPQTRLTAKAICFKEKYWEPFPGLYHCTGLRIAKSLLADGRSSMQDFLNHDEMNSLPVTIETPFSDFSANTTRELESWEQKTSIRKIAIEKRRNQSDKEILSQSIMIRLLAMPEFIAARTVLFYIDARHEVQTHQTIYSRLLQDKRVIVPYCVDDQLQLFHLASIDELAVGSFGILEPKMELRTIQSKHIQTEELDLVVVPGVAFDRSGARLGYGKGFFDRLLQKVRSDTSLVALSFDCQLFDKIPTERHDIAMHKIVTESTIYECNQRTI